MKGHSFYLLWKGKGELVLNKEETRVIEYIYFLAGLNFSLGKTGRNVVNIV